MRLLTFAVLASSQLANAAIAQDMNAAEMQVLSQPTSAAGIELPKDAAGRRVLADYGRCIVSRYGWSQLEVLPESGQERHRMFVMVATPGYCSRYGNFFETVASFLRGIHSEYRLKQDFDLATGAPRHKPAKIFPMPTATAQASMKEIAKATLSFIEYGTCVARVDQGGLAKLFATEIGSNDEKQALTLMSPALSQCLAPGAVLKVNPLKLRGYLAEGTYRSLAARSAQREAR